MWYTLLYTVLHHRSTASKILARYLASPLSQTERTVSIQHFFCPSQNFMIILVFFSGILLCFLISLHFSFFLSERGKLVPTLSVPDLSLLKFPDFGDFFLFFQR